MIVVDVQALQSRAYATHGVGRHVADFVRTLASRHPGVVDAWAFNDRLPRGSVLTELDRQLALGDRLRSFAELRGADVDVLHVPAPFSALARGPRELVDFLDVDVPVRARRRVVTLHDLIPLRFPERYLSDAGDRARYHSRLAALCGADAVLAVSRSAADDAVALAGVDERRVTVMGAGPGAGFRLPSGSAHTRLTRLRTSLPDLRSGFVLVAAADDWRKNLEGTLAGYAQLELALRARHQLVVAAALTPDQAEHVVDEARTLGIAGDLLVPGFVDDTVLVELYQSAALVVVPSRYEGFGLPVVEARACGARVICSDASALPEVLPEPRARFDPDDPASIAQAIRSALSDPGFGAMLDAVAPSEFTWSSAVQRAVECYSRLQHSSNPERGHGRSHRRRLGVVSVLAPTPSGVADHSQHLIDAIAKLDDVELEVFTPSASRRVTGAPGVLVRHVAALPQRWTAGGVDRVVYCVGNDVVHRPLFDMMRVVPGHVLMHDIRLRHLYGRRPPEAHVRDRDYLAGPVAALASGVLVQSVHAADLLHSVTGRQAIDIGPHPCWNAGATDVIDDPGAPWIVSAGIAHASKQTDVFVAAVRLLAGRRDVRAAIVGPGGEAFVAPDDPIVVTGRVSDTEFDEWMRRASLLVQLRSGSNGESSGVAAHAMARGVPLLVSDVGAMRELPDAAAVRVAVDVSPEQLASAIGRLLDAPEARQAMRLEGLAFAARETPGAQARRLVDAVFAGDVRG